MNSQRTPVNPPPPLPAAAPRRSDVAGVPKLALYIILANLGFWLIGGPALYMLNTGNASQIPAFTGCMSAVLVLYLALHWFVWRFYWWINAILMSLTTMIMLGIIASALLGVKLPFPPR